MVSFKQSVIVLVFFFITLSKHKKRQVAPETNLIEHFHVKELKKFVKQYRYVMVLYNKPKTKKGQKSFSWFTKLAKEHDVNEVFFVQIHQNKKKKKPVVKFYVYGFKKDYHGDLGFKAVHEWMLHILEATPQEIKKIEEIPKIDSHYFAVIDRRWFEANQVHLGVLAKLISPLSIFYGLDHEEDKKLTKGARLRSPLYVYREYKQEIIEINPNHPLSKKAKKILDNEFPLVMYPEKSSFRLMTEFGLPALLYFTNNKNDEFIDIITDVAKPYHEYIATMIVLPEKRNKYSKFLKRFLDVKKLPALRIINMQDEVQRHRYIGDLEPSLIDHFIDNYKQSNLKSFALNEELKKNATKNGLKKANYNMVKELMADDHSSNLIYAYSGVFTDIEGDLQSLLVAESVFRNNSNFNVYLLDHDKNDLDSYYHDQLPYLILTSPTNNHWTYTGEITFNSIANFVLSKLPFMRLDEPVFDDDL